MDRTSSLRYLCLLTLCALSTACGNGQNGTSSQDPLGGAGTSASSTAANTQTATSAEAFPPTVTAFSTVTATASTTLTQTVSTTSTVTQSSTVTSTRTQTVTQATTATVTQTVTHSSTQTVTATAENSCSQVALRAGNYSGEQCYFDATASRSLGRNLYARTSYNFLENGKGSQSFTLYEDAACERKWAQSHVNFQYSAAAYFNRLLLIAVEQEVNTKQNIFLDHYWVAAITDGDKLLLDLDSTRGGHSPYLSAPEERELREALAGLEQRAVTLEKK